MEQLSFVIAFSALLLTIIKFSILQDVRSFAVLLALGSGEIYITSFALLVYLVIETRLNHPLQFPKQPFILAALLLFIVLFITLNSTITLRKINEFSQLVFYAIVFVLFSDYMRRQKEIEKLLKIMLVAALVVSTLGIIIHTLSIEQTPHIFLGRGANEGSLFLLLIGILPALTLFAKTKNPTYLVSVMVMLYAIVMADSRTAIGLTMMMVFVALFILIQSRYMRVLVVLLASLLLFGAWLTLDDVFTKLLNYSTLQRIALIQAGYVFWLESPIFGWGLGSTSELAPLAHTDLEYPHFHNTYIQFIVEFGVFGVLLSVIWSFGLFWVFLRGVSGKMSPSVAVYISAMSIVLIGSGTTYALWFGADRALQVIIIFVICREFLLRESQNKLMANSY